MISTYDEYLIGWFSYFMKHIVRLSISPLMKCRLGENLGSRLVCCGIRGGFPILWLDFEKQATGLV